jgi:hypothetical protein
MSNSSRKQRHEAKREAKRKAARRSASVSPWKRLVRAPGEVECWMSDGLETDGQAQVYCYKQAGRLQGLAGFLLDRGVLGLTDAWFQVNISRERFDTLLRNAREEELPLHRVPVEQACRRIAGAARWAHEHGMRLPHEWLKAAQLFGGVGDWKSADVSGFVKVFAGHPEDLVQRCIGEPFESFLSRSDIEFIFSDTAPYETPFDDQEADLDTVEGPLDAETLAGVRQAIDRQSAAIDELVARTQEWVTERGESPSPELAEAWRSIMAAALVSGSYSEEDAQADIGLDTLGQLTMDFDPERLPDLDRAISQALTHLQTDYTMMSQAVLNQPPEHAPPDETADMV